MSPDVWVSQIGGRARKHEWLLYIGSVRDNAIGMPVDGDFGGAFGANRLAMLTHRSSVADFFHRPTSSSPSNQAGRMPTGWSQRMMTGSRSNIYCRRKNRHPGGQCCAYFLACWLRVQGLFKILRWNSWFEVVARARQWKDTQLVAKFCFGHRWTGTVRQDNIYMRVD